MKKVLIGLILFGIYFLLGFLSEHHVGFIAASNNLVSHFFTTIRTEQGITVMSVVTHLGEAVVLYPIIIFAVIIFIFLKQYKAALLLVISTWIVMALTNVFKIFFAVARPSPEFIAAGGFSLPSGHVANATIVLFFIVFGLGNVIKNTSLRFFTIFLSTVYVILVASSRLYLNVHWLSDVVCGALFALSIGYILLGLASYTRRLFQRT